MYLTTSRGQAEPATGDPFATFLLNLIPAGAIILGPDLQVVEENAEARRLLQSLEMVHVRDGRLVMTSVALQKALLTGIRDALRDPARVPEPFSVARPDRPPASFLLLALPRRRGAGGAAASRRHVLLLVSDPEAERPLDQSLLGPLFDLTPSEANVAGSLMGGKDVREIAAETGLSPFTLRNHLKRIFSKTGTSSQLELIHLLLRSPAVLISPGKHQEKANKGESTGASLPSSSELQLLATGREE